MDAPTTGSESRNLHDIVRDIEALQPEGTPLPDSPLPDTQTLRRHLELQKELYEACTTGTHDDRDKSLNTYFEEKGHLANIAEMIPNPDEIIAEREAEEQEAEEREAEKQEAEKRETEEQEADAEAASGPFNPSTIIQHTFLVFCVALAMKHMADALGWW